MPELNSVNRVGIDGALGDLKPPRYHLPSCGWLPPNTKGRTSTQRAHPGLAVPLQLLWETGHRGPQPQTPGITGS